MSAFFRGRKLPPCQRVHLNGRVPPTPACLDLGIDFGTGHLSVDGRHSYDELSSHNNNIKTIRLKEGQNPNVKQAAILLPDGVVIYGATDVANHLRMHPEDNDKVIELA